MYEMCMCQMYMCQMYQMCQMYRIQWNSGGMHHAVFGWRCNLYVDESCRLIFDHMSLNNIKFWCCSVT